MASGSLNCQRTWHDDNANGNSLVQTFVYSCERTPHPAIVWPMAISLLTVVAGRRSHLKDVA